MPGSQQDFFHLPNAQTRYVVPWKKKHYILPKKCIHAQTQTHFHQAVLLASLPRVNDLNISHPHQHDDRRIEVIANGLPLWNAVDTTLVSPLTREGQPRRRAGRFAGAALQDARKSKERTYPELLNNKRCRLVVLAIEVGGRWSEEAAAFVATGTRHPPTQRCSRSHCTLDRHPDTCSHDPLCSQPSRRSHPKSLQRWSQSSQLEPNPGRSPDRPTPFQSTSSTPVSTCMGPGLLPFVFLVCLETDQ